MGKYLKTIDNVVKTITSPSKIHIKTKLCDFTEVKDTSKNKIIVFYYYINNECDIEFFEQLEKVLNVILKSKFNVDIINHNQHKCYRQNDAICLYIEYE
jgi:hypothetical protein